MDRDESGVSPEGNDIVDKSARAPDERAGFKAGKHLEWYGPGRIKHMLYALVPQCGIFGFCFDDLKIAAHIPVVRESGLRRPDTPDPAYPHGSA